MALIEFASSALARATRGMRRRATGYLVAGILFSSAILYTAAAALIALEAAIGPVGARLVLAALCVAAGALIVILVRKPAAAGTPHRASAAHEKGAAPEPRQLQLAMLVEALLLGFSASRQKRARR